MNIGSAATDIDLSLRRRVAAYCQRHAKEFEAEINNYLRLYLLRGRIIIIVGICLTASGLLSAVKTGNWILVFSHLPASLLFAAYPFLAARFTLIDQKAAAYCDVISKVMVVESILTFYIFHRNGQIELLASQAPSLMMLVIWILNFHVNSRRAVLLGLGSCALVLVPASWLEPDYVLINMSAFLIGAGIGLALRSLIMTLFHYKFYFGQQEKTLRTHAYEQLEKMLYPHQLTMIEGGLVLEKTMPLGWGEACVVAFDVIDSSKIKSPNARGLLENTLRKCHAVMMQNYSPERFEANAYRIKEMGDGFLCSLGHPFQVPASCQRENLAVVLARRFIEIFHEEVDRIADGEPIHCAVGIASGGIDAFYSQSSPKEYDIYGRPLILATRYEAARRELFQFIPKTSLIVIQAQVYEKLDPVLSRGFIRFDLSSFKIRDDHEATCLYYQVIDSDNHLVSQRKNQAG